MRKLPGFKLLMAGAAGYAFAQQSAPEIDPSSGITAMALLSGPLVVFCGRRRSK